MVKGRGTSYAREKENAGEDTGRKSTETLAKKKARRNLRTISRNDSLNGFKQVRWSPQWGHGSHQGLGGSFERGEGAGVLTIRQKEGAGNTGKGKQLGRAGSAE